MVLIIENKMDINKFFIESCTKFPNLVNEYIGKVLFHASEMDCDEFILNNVGIINLVNQKDFETIILNLCNKKKYDIISLLLQSISREKFDNFDYNKLSQLFPESDINFVKAHITKFTNIMNNINQPWCVYILCKHNDIDLIKLVFSYCKNKNIIRNCLFDMTIRLCNNNNLNMLEKIFREFHEEIKTEICPAIRRSLANGINIETFKFALKTFPDINIIYDNLYYKLIVNNKSTILQYMFDNYDYNYINDIFRKRWLNVIENKTMKILLEDIIKKIFSLSMTRANYLFKICCRDGNYYCAYILKKCYPEIDINISCDEKHKKLYDWLQNGCPIINTTKSAMKIV